MCIVIPVCSFFPYACCYWFTWIVFDVFASVYFVHVALLCVRLSLSHADVVGGLLATSLL